MKRVGVWLVPTFLVLVGLLFIADGYGLTQDAQTNFVYERAYACYTGPNENVTFHSCVTPSACQAECFYGWSTIILGGTVVAVGTVMGAVRIAREGKPPRLN
jgi:hypothetical protein